MTEIYHRAGRIHCNADALSRIDDAGIWNKSERKPVAAISDFSHECMDVNFFSNVHLLGYKMILLMYRRSSLYVFID